MELSIIIVSWNVAELLEECLESIFNNPIATGTDYEVIVVDSASGDYTVSMIREKFPQVRLLAQAENVGFSRGNNIGLEAATGDYLLLLNPDTVVLGDALAVMTAYLKAHPEAGIVGPYTLNTDGTPQSTRRRFPTPLIAFFESTWLQPIAPRRLLDHYYTRDLPALATIAVDWVQGSALLMRRAVYEQIGGLDTRFVMYSEELDWCKRAKLAGWQVIYLCTAQIIHHGGKSSDQASARKHIHFQESKLRYFHKYHGRTFAEILRVFLLVNYLIQIALEGMKALLGHKRDLRQERIAVYRQVLHSGLKVT